MSGSNFAITKDAGRSNTLKATDPEGDTLTYTIVTPPAPRNAVSRYGWDADLHAGRRLLGRRLVHLPGERRQHEQRPGHREPDGRGQVQDHDHGQRLQPDRIEAGPGRHGSGRNRGTAARTITDTSGMGPGASINPGSRIRLPVHPRPVSTSTPAPAAARPDCCDPGEDLAGGGGHGCGPNRSTGRSKTRPPATCSTSRSGARASPVGPIGGPASRRQRCVHSGCRNGT